MGFRGGKNLQYGTLATFWKIQRVADNGKTCDVQISISKKNKQTDQYETDFSGFVKFCGENMVNLAKTLKEKDKIDIESFELTNHYDKEKRVTYYNVSVFAAKKAEFNNSNSGSTNNTPAFDPSVPADMPEELPFN